MLQCVLSTRHETLEHGGFGGQVIPLPWSLILCDKMDRFTINPQGSLVAVGTVSLVNSNLKQQLLVVREPHRAL